MSEFTPFWWLDGLSAEEQRICGAPGNRITHAERAGDRIDAAQLCRGDVIERIGVRCDWLMSQEPDMAPTVTG